jgi:hypothetical protein
MNYPRDKIRLQETDFEELPDVTELINVVKELMELRLSRSLDFPTVVSLKFTYIDNYIKSVEKTEQAIRKIDQMVFLEWINDHVTLFSNCDTTTHCTTHDAYNGTEDKGTDNLLSQRRTPPIEGSKLLNAALTVYNPFEPKITSVQANANVTEETLTVYNPFERKITSVQANANVTEETTRKRVRYNKGDLSEQKEKSNITVDERNLETVLKDNLNNGESMLLKGNNNGLNQLGKEIDEIIEIDDEAEEEDKLTEDIMNNNEKDTEFLLKDMFADDERKDELSTVSEKITNCKESNEDATTTVSYEVQRSNDILRQMKYTKDPSVKMNKFENKRIHATWFRKNLMIRKEEIMMKVGFIKVEYPNSALKIRGIGTESTDVIDNGTQCCCCAAFFSKDERVVFIRGSGSEGKKCDHNWCENCAYMWYIKLPDIDCYLKTDLLEEIVYECGKCPNRGNINMRYFSNATAINNSERSWIEVEVLRENQHLYGIHQISSLHCCNYITDYDLFKAIENYEKLSPTELPTDEYTAKYDLYYKALRNKFECKQCKLNKSILEMVVHESCEEGCDVRLCLSCAAEAIVNRFGSRKGGSDLKYLAGCLQCQSCKGNESRMISSLTRQYITKYK